MNYYEHHIGDYDKNTSHLTACEDGIYSRMIRRYLDKEMPLDVDVKEIKRIVRARNREEKSAVDSILKEFFHLESDGFHHKKCDEIIANYLAGEPEREVKKANEDNRMKRHREERARLFKIITDAGQHAPWNIGMAELRELSNRVAEQQPDLLSLPLPATAPATPATATQAPITTTHTPRLTSKASSSGGSTVPDREDQSRVAPPPLPMREGPPLSGDYAIRMSAVLRRLGVDDALFTHPAVQTWAAEYVTDEILEVAVAKARLKKGDAKIPANYLVGIVHDLLNPPELATAAVRNTGARAWNASAKGIEKKGKAMGLTQNDGELHRDYAIRIQAEIDNRKGVAP